MPLVDAFGPDATVATDAGIVDPGTEYGTPDSLGGVSGDLVEISGIVASREQENVFFVHNDSGGGNHFFAIDRSADTLAMYTVTGVATEDWEDIAISDDASGEILYLANVGDNEAREADGASGRSHVELYRLPAPDASLGDATLNAEVIELHYPSRPYDCESVFVHHATGDVYLLTKETSPAEVFVARAPLLADTAITLEHAGTVDFSIATAADMSRDDARIVVRGYGTIQVHERAAGESPIEALNHAFTTAPTASAAEAVCFESRGYGLYTISEGAGATLFYIPWE